MLWKKKNKPKYNYFLSVHEEPKSPNSRQKNHFSFLSHKCKSYPPASLWGVHWIKGWGKGTQRGGINNRPTVPLNVDPKWRQFSSWSYEGLSLGPVRFACLVPTHFSTVLYNYLHLHIWNLHQELYDASKTISSIHLLSFKKESIHRAHKALFSWSLAELSLLFILSWCP